MANKRVVMVQAMTMAEADKFMRKLIARLREKGLSAKEYASVEEALKSEPDLLDKPATVVTPKVH